MEVPDVASETVLVVLKSAISSPAMTGVIALGTGDLAIIVMPGMVVTTRPPHIPRSDNLISNLGATCRYNMGDVGVYTNV